MRFCPERKTFFPSDPLPANMNKSKVRQTALVLIYSVLEHGGDAATFDFDLFWSIAQEKEVERYILAQARAIGHICRASKDMDRLLAERVQAVLGATQGDLTTARLREDVARYVDQSTLLAGDLQKQQICLVDKRRDILGQLSKDNKNVILRARAVEGLGRNLLPTLADYPAYRSVLDPFAAILRRQGRMLALCASVETPEALAGSGEFTSLIRSAEMLAELRPATERLARGVLAHREEYDARIATRLENYSPERLDVLDKSILYLALYELEVNGLEVPIVISEATALADAYSGSKSAPFIHGVLAALLRKD